MAQSTLEPIPSETDTTLAPLPTQPSASRPARVATFAQYALPVTCLLWAGMILGISFLEAPVKFTAPSLTLPVGLDVGRHVFGAFNKVEIVFTGWCLGLLAGGGRRSPWRWLAVAVGALVIQTFWLMPPMETRIAQIIAGQTVPSAPYHLLYILLELLKLFALSATGIQGMITNKATAARPLSASS